MPIKNYYPEFDFPDRPRGLMALSEELLDISCDKRHGIVIRRPDLHAAGIEIGLRGLKEHMRRKEWAPYPGPPIFLVLSVGFEQACKMCGWEVTEEGEVTVPPERPKEK